MQVETLKRLPLYSLAAGAVVAAMLMVSALSGMAIPAVGLGALAVLPLAAALVDAVRLRHKTLGDGAGQGSPRPDVHDDDAAELEDWLNEKSESLTTREQVLNARALALQQWMQFPDVIHFRVSDFDGSDAIETASLVDAASRSADAATRSQADPLARHDRELFELIETKTHDLFDKIKKDAYRKSDGDRKVFDNETIQADVVALVSDVAAIYRPGETSPLLRTNVEALSRAVGRASLRLLVAVETLPGGLASYDFQSIYNLVIRAVKTFGYYKAAKPYLDVASGVLFAGRIISSTNPLTLAAWWAASKATTYGASRLGSHLLDQQAVGLIRQLVEIVAIEVASIYSPMVRYRDVHWVYGVELVHLASELVISDAARVEAMRQLAALHLRDEYGRVSLMRHLAGGTTSRPANYQPSRSLSAADRMIVVQRLEAFLLAHILNNKSSRSDKASITNWQTAASERLEIQFRAGTVETTTEQQIEQACWALVAFLLEYFGDEVDQAIDRIKLTQTWGSVDEPLRSHLVSQWNDNPPYLYQPPAIEPERDICQRFLDDLVTLAASRCKPILPDDWNWPDTAESVVLPPWPGEEAIATTAYFLRSDAADCLSRFQQLDAKRLLGDTGRSDVPRRVARVLDVLLGHSPDDQPLRAMFSDGKIRATPRAANLARIGPTLICFSVDENPHDDLLTMSVIARSLLSEATIEKVAGYVRNDCRVRFPGGTEVDLPGSTLAGYDSYFRELLAD